MLRKDSLPPPQGPFILEWYSYYAEAGLPAPSSRYYPPDIGAIIMLRKYSLPPTPGMYSTFLLT